MPDHSIVSVRRPRAFMTAWISSAPDDAILSLEGDLTYCDLRGIPVLGREEAGPYRRHTAWPLRDFVLLPITAATRARINRQLWPRVGLRTRVHHLCCYHDGHLILGAYDTFAANLTSVDPVVGAVFLADCLRHGWIDPPGKSRTLPTVVPGDQNEEHPS